MFDKSTIPQLNVKPGKYGSVEIIKQDKIYLLNHSDVMWNVYSLPGGIREYSEQWSGYDLAYGDVLLSGFGFGQMATWVASKPSVNSVTVLEISEDIIKAFLVNNDLPNNVSVIIADADTYITNKKYDCIIYDHIANGQPDVAYYKSLCDSAKKIKHDLFWFWSIEFYYAKFYYNKSWDELYLQDIDYNKNDFGQRWSLLKDVLNMPTIPMLSKEKIEEYLKSYFIKL